MKDNNGKTAVVWAKQNGHKDVYEFLKSESGILSRFIIFWAKMIPTNTAQLIEEIVRNLVTFSAFNKASN